MADAHGWPDTDRTLMLQCVFRGKAQRVYSALSMEDSRDYEKVKSAVLKAYRPRDTITFWSTFSELSNRSISSVLGRRGHIWRVTNDRIA